MRYPRHMTLELTAKCNFRCPYCYCVWHEYPALAKPELDAAKWKTILEKCAADGVDDILFTGGEALLRSDLFEILNYARRVLPKAKFSLFTNASRLDELLVKKFKRSKIHLATSLQGLQTYGAMTGTRRSYKRLLAVVARASELKWPLAVSMTVTKANLDEAADMFVAAALSGASAIQMGPVILGGRAAANQELMKVLKRLEPEMKAFSFEKYEGLFENLPENEKKEEILNIRNGISFARKVMTTGGADVLILDEVLGLVDLGILSQEELRQFIAMRPEEMQLIITGKVFPEEMKDCVDLVSRIETVYRQ